MAREPSFLITIDTEGDNLWSRPSVVTTRNAEFLPRFQSLCEKYGFKPTYLTDYDMARSPAFIEFARDAERREMAEVGMHLHAWNSPPLDRLTADDNLYHPYLIEYPVDAIRSKVSYITKLLEDTFGHSMRSHRAGRWAFNSTYAKVLVEHGYAVDCSVTPFVSWRSHPGDPKGSGGADYTRYPHSSYRIDLNDISQGGTSSLLEVPMTIVARGGGMWESVRERFPPRSITRRILSRLVPPPIWFRPMRGNRADMLQVVATAKHEKRDYIEFMLHSSEFMPGGSPAFPDVDAIERLYDDLEAIFSKAAEVFRGSTLTDYAVRFLGSSQGAT